MMDKAPEKIQEDRRAKLRWFKEARIKEVATVVSSVDDEYMEVPMVGFPMKYANMNELLNNEPDENKREQLMLEFSKGDWAEIVSVTELIYKK